MRTISRRAAPVLVLVLLPLIGLVSPSTAQGGQAGERGIIRGVVVAARTEQPLARVLVRLAETGHVATTGADGRFELVGVEPGAYTLTASVVGYALVRRAVVVQPGALLEFIVVLTPGTGTYEERVDVVAPLFESREIGTVAERAISGIELQDLREMVADDPLRAVQALPGVTASDDFTAEFAARGSGPGTIGVVLDGVPAAAVLLHAIEGRDDSGSIARVSSDVLSGASLLLGSYPQRYGDRLGPQLEFTSRDGSRDRFHLRATASTVGATAIAEGPLAGGKGSWLAAYRQSYLQWVLRRWYSQTSWLGFSDAFGKVALDLSARHRLTFTVVAGRAHYEDRPDTADPNWMADAVNRGGLMVAALRSGGSSWIVNQRAFVLLNRFQNQRADGSELGIGRRREVGYRADATRVLSARVALDVGAHVQRSQERQRFWAYDRRLPTRGTALQDYDGAAVIGGGFGHVRWQPNPRTTLSAGGRVDRTTAIDGVTVSPWAQVERKLAGGLTARAGTGLYHQAPSMEQVAGLHGSGALSAQRALHADVGIERALGARARWQLSLFDREERDLAWASGLETRAAGGLVPFDRLARYESRLEGHARGAELLVQRRDPNGLSGWVAYAWARSRYRDPVTGESFAGDYDQRHTLTAYGSLRLWSRTTVSSKLRAGSNIPVRGYYQATGQQDAEGLPTFVLGRVRNAARLPAYARFDARVSHVFNFSTRRLTLFAELINIFNRTNVGLAGGRSVQKLLPFIPAGGCLVEF